MNYMVGALAILSAVILTGAAISLFALYRMQELSRQIRAHSAAPRPPADRQGDGELRQAIAALAAEVNELKNSATAEPQDPLQVRPGLNLSKRSQALRMHRRGDSAGQIASALQIPQQEVDLLLKVHSIVLSHV